MERPIPKRHHYIPISLLERFTDDDRKLYYFNKRCPQNGVRPSSPEDLFLERHLYSSKARDGTKDDSLERHYIGIEGQSKPVIEKIVLSARRGHEPNLTVEERQTFDLFFCTLWQRVPDLRDQVFDQMDIHSTLKELVAGFGTRRRPLSASEARDIQNPNTVERIMHNAMIHAIKGPSLNILAVLEQKGLCIAITRKPGKSFVIGSLPIVKMAFPGREHVLDPTVETWLPIAFDVAITPAFLPLGREVLREIEDDAIIRNINRGSFKKSTIIAGRSPKLVASLARPR